MEEESHVKLHGWASPYVIRVELALKIKGVPFEYVEEVLTNKSQLLLQYNPVHKKVPVLVHNGKPIAESMVILEYIDETWSHGPRLLPRDPYERAKVRFWASFLHHQVTENLTQLFKCNGEEAQEKVEMELHEKMKLLEEGLGDMLPEDQDGITSTENHLWLLNILMMTILSPYEAQEEVLGKKILDPERYPRTHSWVVTLNKLPLLKELLPPHEKLVSIFSNIKFPEKLRALLANTKPH